MTVVNDPNVEGFVGGVRLAWVVHLMLIHDEIGLSEAVSTASSNELGYINLCLESVFANNVFQFLLNNVLRSPAYQVDKVILERCFSISWLLPLLFWSMYSLHFVWGNCSISFVPFSQL